MQRSGIPFFAAICLSISIGFTPLPASAEGDEPKVHKLKIEEKGERSPEYVRPYGPPVMVSDPTKKIKGNVDRGPANDPKKPKKPPEPPKPPKPADPPKSPKPAAPLTKVEPVMDDLPPEFLGRWTVLGRRSAVTAEPQYQSGMSSIFAGNTNNVWIISGSADAGYLLGSDSGVKQPLLVERTGSKAILRYQHPMNKTMVQEAVVMELQPGGAQFHGLERITVVKQGEPKPRATVTYELVGSKN